MQRIYPNILDKPRFQFENGFERVVQKGNVGSKYVYALQLYRNITYVMRGRRDDNSSKVYLDTSRIEEQYYLALQEDIHKLGNMLVQQMKITIMAVGLLAQKDNVKKEVVMIGIYNQRV